MKIGLGTSGLRLKKLQTDNWFDVKLSWKTLGLVVKIFWATIALKLYALLPLWSVFSEPVWIQTIRSKVVWIWSDFSHLVWNPKLIIMSTDFSILFTIPIQIIVYFFKRLNLIFIKNTFFSFIRNNFIRIRASILGKTYENHKKIVRLIIQVLKRSLKNIRSK